MPRNNAARVCQSGQGGDTSHDLESQIFITQMAEHRIASHRVWGGIPVYQRRAVSTERLSMARFQGNATRKMKRYYDVHVAALCFE